MRMLLSLRATDLLLSLRATAGSAAIQFYVVVELARQKLVRSVFGNLQSKLYHYVLYQLTSILYFI